MKGEGEVELRSRGLLTIELADVRKLMYPGFVVFALMLFVIGGSGTGVASATSQLAMTNVQLTPGTIDQNTDSATISYTLSGDRAAVMIDIYDPSKNIIRTIDAGVHDPGTHQVSWDCRDTSNNRVVQGLYTIEVNARSVSYDFVSKWGGPGSGDTQFSNPMGITVDPSGNVYVADYGNGRVKKFSSSGSYILKWGPDDGSWKPAVVSAASDDLVFVSDKKMISKCVSIGDAPGASFLNIYGKIGGSVLDIGPTSITTDSGGNIYFADGNNDRICKLSPEGTFITQWGSFGNGPYQFNEPWGIVVDQARNMYVLDGMNRRIHKFSANGDYTDHWAGQAGGNGEIVFPVDVEAGSNDIVFVVDDVHWIKMYTPAGDYLGRFGGEGTGDGQFNWASDVAVNRDGYVYVTDYSAHRVQRFAPHYATSIGMAMVTVQAGEQSTYQLHTSATPQTSPTQVSTGKINSTSIGQIGRPGSKLPTNQTVNTPSGTPTPTLKIITGPGSSTTATATPAPTQSIGLIKPGLKSNPAIYLKRPGVNLLAIGNNSSPTFTDTVAPVTTITIWTDSTNSSLACVTLNSTDEGGAGVLKTVYSFDGANWTRYASPFNVSTADTTTVYALSVDWTGNTEIAKTANISATPGNRGNNTGLCAAVLLPLLVVGMVTAGIANKRKERKN